MFYRRGAGVEIWVDDCVFRQERRKKAEKKEIKLDYREMKMGSCFSSENRINSKIKRNIFGNRVLYLGSLPRLEF